MLNSPITLFASWHHQGGLALWGAQCEQPFGTSLQESSSQEFIPVAPSQYLPLFADILEGFGEEQTLSLPVPVAQISNSTSRILGPEHLRQHLQANTTPIHLRRIECPSLVLNVLDSLVLCSSLPTEVPPGIVFGEPLLFWVECTKFVLELLTRGMFLPTARWKQDSVDIRWEPVLSDESSAQKLETLIAAAPLGALANTLEPSFIDPQVAVRSFISMSVDTLARTFLRRLPPPRRTIPGQQHPTVHELFLNALTTTGTVEAYSALLDWTRLEERLQTWSSRFLSRNTGEELQLLFRLKEPSSAQGTWLIELNAVTSSGTLPAAGVWSEEFSAAGNSEISERFLSALGRACQVWPLLHRALTDSFPEKLELTRAEAYDFLTKRLDSLRGSGFLVELPDTLLRAEESLGLALNVSPPGSGRDQSLGLNQLLDFNWRVALGNEILTKEEFSALLASNETLVPYNGRWLMLDSSRARTIEQFLERSHAKLTLADALRFGLLGEVPEHSLRVTKFDAAGWIGELLRQDQGLSLERDQPAIFQGTLRPYQLVGLNWMWSLEQLGLGTCLADDMGLGKTVQLLALILREREEATAAPTLLVVPLSILGNWETESKRFAPSLRVFVHHGTDRASGAQFETIASENDLVITTYHTVVRDEQILSDVTWRRIVLDEAQNIKNLNTKQNQAIRRLTTKGLISGERFGRIALTGTPLENHLEELWAIFDFLNPGYLGSREQFRRRFAVPVEKFRDTAAGTKLSALLRPFLLRRKKTDAEVMRDLPEKIEMNEYTQLEPAQVTLYEQVLGEMLPQVESSSGIRRRGLVLSAITKLKQICDHPALVSDQFPPTIEHSGKLKRTIELVETLIEEGDRCLIFTQYVKMGRVLEAVLKERFHTEIPFLHGSLSRKEREDLIQRFRQEGGPPIFILSLRAGGFGLNLPEANQVIHFDQWWNPAVESQATDRVHRIGQTKTVQVRRLICRGTLEEKIHALVQEKRELAEQVIGSASSVVTELSSEELRSLLQLSGSVLRGSAEEP